MRSYVLRMLLLGMCLTSIFSCVTKRKYLELEHDFLAAEQNLKRQEASNARQLETIARLRMEVQELQAVGLSPDLAEKVARADELEQMLRKREDFTQALEEKYQQLTMGLPSFSTETRNGKVYVTGPADALVTYGHSEAKIENRKFLWDLSDAFKADAKNFSCSINFLSARNAGNDQFVEVGKSMSAVIGFLADSGKVDFEDFKISSGINLQSDERIVEFVLEPKFEELFAMVAAPADIKMALKSEPSGATVYVIPKWEYDRMTKAGNKAKDNGALRIYQVHNGKTPTFEYVKEYSYIILMELDGKWSGAIPRNPLRSGKDTEAFGEIK